MPKISALTEATALDADDEIYAVVDGDSRRVTMDTLTGYIDAPAKPTSASGEGNFTAINPAVGADAVLPAGGEWAYALYRFNSGVVASSSFGVAAGGTTIGAGTSGQNWSGFAWRVE